MEVDLSRLEHELCRIPEVTAARVVTDRTGEVAEVHILATTSKQAKQVVRDVQSVAMAACGVDVDRRVISVVQLEDRNGNGNGSGVPRPEPAEPANPVEPTEILEPLDTDEPPAAETMAAADTPAPSPVTRVTVEGVAYARHGFRSSVEVMLGLAGVQVRGTAEGSSASSSAPRLVAEATLAALRHLQPAAARADVESAAVFAVGDRRIATTSLVLSIPPHEEFLVGSAVVRAAGDHDAMARAVLDATNRRLTRLS